MNERERIKEILEEAFHDPERCGIAFGLTDSEVYGIVEEILKVVNMSQGQAIEALKLRDRIEIQNIKETLGQDKR